MANLLRARLHQTICMHQVTSCFLRAISSMVALMVGLLCFNLSALAAPTVSIAVSVLGPIGGGSPPPSPYYGSPIVAVYPTDPGVVQSGNTTNYLPGDFNVTATPANFSSAITKVDFYDVYPTTPQLLGTATASPYTFSTMGSGGVLPGIYRLKAVVTDALGGVTESSVYSVQFDDWTHINLTSPANGSTFVAGRSLTLSANATSATSYIKDIEFWGGNGNNSLLATITAPSNTYTLDNVTYIWNNVPAGTTQVLAVANDKLGLKTITKISVRANTPPTVSLTSPAEGTKAVSPGSFTLDASATSSTSSISKVDFYANSNLIGTDTAAPYTFTWNNVTLGTYNLYAIATDNFNVSKTSSTKSVSVIEPPTVALVSPTMNAIAMAPGTFTLEAHAGSTVSTISKVDFYANSILIGTATSEPFTYTWGDIAVGTYSLFARATDGNGLATDTSQTPVAVTVATTPDVTFQYDQGVNGKGHLTGVIDTTGTTAYSYDIHGRLIKEVTQRYGATYTTGYDYDIKGRLASITYPSGRAVDYAFDAMGRINQIVTTFNGETQMLVSNIVYQPFGGVKSFTFGDGSIQPVQAYVRQFDQDGRIASYTLSDRPMTIGYDSASQIVSISDQTNIVNYNYDLMGRLSDYTHGSTSQHLDYDADGNRTQISGSTNSTYSYPPDSNRLGGIQTGTNSQFITQDANGSITDDGSRQFTYDVRGRLIQTTSAQGDIKYEVNALGLRVRKQVPYANTDTVYHYDIQGHLIGESNAGAILFTREYIYLGDLPVAVLR